LFALPALLLSFLLVLLYNLEEIVYLMFGLRYMLFPFPCHILDSCLRFCLSSGQFLTALMAIGELSLQLFQCDCQLLLIRQQFGYQLHVVLHHCVQLLPLFA
jgi:hypothetical protein